MVNWQEVGRVISAVHHHGHQGLKTSEIQKLVRKQPESNFNFKHALDEAVRSGFLTVRNRRFYPCNWQELVSTRRRGARLPRTRQTWASDSFSDVQKCRRRSPRRRKESHRGRKRAAARREPSRAYARRRYVKTRKNSKSSHSGRRRRRPPRSRSRGRKVSRPARRKETRVNNRRARSGSDDKIAPDGTNRVTPAEHATGKNYPPQ